MMCQLKSRVQHNALPPLQELHKAWCLNQRLLQHHQQTCGGWPKLVFPTWGRFMKGPALHNARTRIAAIQGQYLCGKAQLADSPKHKVCQPASLPDTIAQTWPLTPSELQVTHQYLCSVFWETSIEGVGEKISSTNKNWSFSKLP